MNAVETMQVELTREPVRDVAAFSTWRLMVWQVRRELWENRAVWIAPVATIAVLLVLWVVGLIQLVRKTGPITMVGEPQFGDPLLAVWSGGAMLLLFVGLLVAFFYSLDALYGERRERSILFWKSMPVSNGVTLLAKFMVPTFVVPVVTWVLAMLWQMATLLVATITLWVLHMSAASAWHAGFIPSAIAVAYWVIVVTLWYAPLYALFLLISASAPRQPFLMTVVPVLVLMGAEGVVWHTVRFGSFVGHCFSGVFLLARDTTSSGYQGFGVGRVLGTLTPQRFFASPHLWVGLVVAAVMLVLAARVRRSQVAA